MTGITVALATVLSLAFTPVAAQNYKKGMDAHNAGDYETAFNEWLPLAERGVANAQFALGVTYLTGLGVSLDHAVAVKWFRLAAEQGDAKHQSMLGAIYVAGNIVPQDYITGIKWYRLAAEQGDAESQNNLAAMYEKNWGVLQDNVLAHMWYNLAAANGSEVASPNRARLADTMTPAAIEKAQAMARECMSSGYQKCGY